MSNVCSYFARGSCRFGNQCWNSHDILSTRSYSPYQHQEIIHDDETYSTIEPTISSSSISNTTRNNHPSSRVQKSQTEPERPWNLTNNVTENSRENSPDRMLIEVVKKLSQAENEVKTLKQKLGDRNVTKNFSLFEYQMSQSVDSDLQCDICYEMFIKPIVLNCSHTFCHDCIEKWTKRVNHCPTCRVYIKTKSYCLILDNFLDKMSECLPDDLKSKRETLKVDRTNTRAAAAENRNRRSTRRRNNRNNSFNQRILGSTRGEQFHGEIDWNYSFDDTLFDPVHLGDVLGRNRYDREDGSWEDNSDTSMDRFHLFG